MGMLAVAAADSLVPTRVWLQGREPRHYALSIAAIYNKTQTSIRSANGPLQT